jgi:tetratricopeptide (TPR) repeat protein
MDQLLQRLLAVSMCAAILAPARAASAQHRPFLEGLSEFTAAIAGTYGDEGTRVGPALDKMAAALAQWDRELQAVEADVTAGVRTATPDVAVRLRTGLAGRYVQRGRLADALREVDAAISLEPLAPALHLFRAQLLAALSRTAEAGGAFRRAWTGNTRDPVAAYHVLQHAATLDQQDVQEAGETLRAAYRALPDGRPGEKSVPFSTIDPLQQGSGEVPDVVPAAYRLGYARLAGGEYGEAIAELRRAAATDPLVTDPFSRTEPMVRAIEALRQGRPAEARARLERADGRGDSSEAHRVLGLIDWTESRYDQSVAALTAAIRTQPHDERSRLALSRVLHAAGRRSDAERALRETIEVLPDSALAHVWLGRASEDANRLAEARQEFEIAAPGVFAGRGTFLASIARLASGIGDFQQAIEALGQAIAATPNDAELHKRRAHALLQEDRAGEAFGELVAALLIDPLDGGAHLGVGRLHLNAGRYQDAVVALRRAVQLLPAHTEARYALATALVRLGNTREAAQEFDRVEQAQRREIEERRRALTLDTLKEEAMLRMAEGRYDRAATLWRQALEREPERASNHLQLAAALASADRTEMAIEHYETALRLGAEPLVYRQLADLYASAGRPADAARARALYTRALQRTATSGSSAR